MSRDYSPIPETVAGADPAAGSEATYTADGDMVVELVRFDFVTSATVANRFPGLKLTDVDGNEVYRVSDPTARTASGTYRYSAFPGAPGTQSEGLAMPARGLRMRDGDVLSTVTTAIDAGDNYGPLKLRIRRW